MPDLIRLTYISRCNFKQTSDENGIEPTVARILLHSRLNNPKKRIGGVLYFGDGYFFQCLEGEADVVNELITRIIQDKRHTDVNIRKVVPISRRVFSNWSMKYISLENEVNDLLNRHKLSSFNPYKFSEKLTDELIELFVNISDPQSKPDQNYIDQPEPEKGFLQRIKNLFGFASKSA
jgi:hypothetical protein